jgi:hypothetical protein
MALKVITRGEEGHGGRNGRACRGKGQRARLHWTASDPAALDPDQTEDDDS